MNRSGAHTPEPPNSAWIAETTLPIVALRAASRNGAVLGLLGLEAVILTLTGEVSFGFTVVACLLSFFPRAARRTYPAAFVVLVVSAVALRYAA